jgi:hypothetical protein
MLGEISQAVLDEKDLEKWDRNITVEDCSIVGTGVEYSGSTGLFAGYVANLTVVHNLFANQSYSAMTLGWGWGREGSGRGGIQVMGNRIVDFMLARCCDRGAIYTLGPAPSSQISRNYIAQTAATTPRRWPIDPAMVNRQGPAGASRRARPGCTALVSTTITAPVPGQITRTFATAASTITLR